eukprot:2307713-Amphidinium_carterae.1
MSPPQSLPVTEKLFLTSDVIQDLPVLVEIAYPIDKRSSIGWIRIAPALVSLELLCNGFVPVALLALGTRAFLSDFQNRPTERNEMTKYSLPRA